MSEDYKGRPVTDDEVASVTTELSTADAYGFNDRISAGQALRRAVDLIERLAEAQRPTIKRLPDGAQVIEPGKCTLLVPATQPISLPTDQEIEAWCDECANKTRGGSGEDYWVYEIAFDDVKQIVRGALARWGQPAVDLIPLSERRPGPEDCNHGLTWASRQLFGKYSEWS